MRKHHALHVLWVLSNATWFVDATYTVVTHTRDGVVHAVWFFGFLVATPLNVRAAVQRDRRRRVKKYGTAEQPRLVAHDGTGSGADPWTLVEPGPPAGKR